MFRFEHPEALYLLVLVPLYFVLNFYFQKYKNRKIQSFGNQKTIDRLKINPISKTIQKTKTIGIGIVLLLISITLANPQWSNKRESVQQESADIYLAIDISNSMNAQDIKPNRLEKAKSFAIQLLNKLKGDRVGLILFAGNAYMQMPLTNDYAAAELFIKTANTSQAPSQGTAIGEAINMAYKNIKENAETESNRGIVIITDGEDHSQEAIDAAKEAYNNGVVTYLVGVGTEKGAPIPQYYRGKWIQKRDQSGQVVISKLNKEMVKEVANAGKGNSYLMSHNNEKIIESLSNSLGALDKRELEIRSFKKFESYYQYFLFPIVIIAFIILFSNINFKTKKIAKTI